MLWHTSPTAIYVKSERDLSHIELEQSDNISSSSKARTYRVGKADISTEEKMRARAQGEENPYILALSVYISKLLKLFLKIPLLFKYYVL